MEVKNIWKGAACLLMGAALGLGNAACSDDNNGGNSGELSAQEQALKLVAKDYIEKTVVPTYRGMADATMELYDKCLTLRKAGAGNITKDMVQDACNS